MGTKRNGKFYRRVIKRMHLRRQAARSSDPDAKLVEECRNAQEVLLPEALADERELEGLCYHEYAYMRPHERDRAFAEAMNRVAARWWPEFHGHGTDCAPELKYPWVHTVADLNIPEVRSAIRRARQHFDARGFHYETAIQRVFGERILYNGGHGLPRPNQLFSTLALIAIERDRMLIEERTPEPLEHDPVDPHFLACHYTGRWAQRKALDAMQGYVKGKTGAHNILGRYLARGLISEQEARARMGDDLVDEAIAAWGPARYTVNGGSEVDLPPDEPLCLGLSFDLTEATCQACTVKDRCGEITAKVRAAQIAAFGTDDVRALRAREDAAERQRRRTARKRNPNYEAEREQIRRHLEHLMGISLHPEDEGKA